MRRFGALSYSQRGGKNAYERLIRHLEDDKKNMQLCYDKEIPWTSDEGQLEES